jgi:hypothetical protein
MEIIKLRDVKEKIITIREQRVILDSDVAELYSVETKEVNQATKNNPQKFPDGYILEVSETEYRSLRSKFLTLENSGRGKHKKYLPKAFTEKGLYMLATILKSERATQTTIEIIEAFAQLREFQKTVVELSETTEEYQQKSLMKKGGDIFSELLGSELKTSEAETSIEINMAVVKFKHTIKKK